ncbi:MAG: sigma-54 dependent transcriptional regulator [Gammaproteobacteria bacterium]|nr:sigma-54 dependent transcriptional regulator [Gammaproteobacteria bacterium]
MTEQLDVVAHAGEVPALKKRVLVVEDEAVFAKAVCKRLEKTGYQCAIAGTLDAAHRKFQEMEPDLILLDMRLPDGSGLDFLADLRRKYRSGAAVLVLSAYGEVEDAVAAMKLNASDYVKKPIDLDELLVNVQKVFGRDELARRLAYSHKRESHAAAGVELLGESPDIKRVREQIARISKLTSAPDVVPPTVLLLGATGTGKDVVARLLHASSARRERSFVQVDCASLPKDLIEAELFGHEKGAFTSAYAARTGLIEAAEDGVLLLDEIGELPLDLQSKLLAVLERRTLRRVGSPQERAVPAWFIASTNRDLEALVKEGRFRSDLFYRFNVLSLYLSPLHERGDDVLILARHFAKQTSTRYGLDEPAFSTDAEQAIKGYSWPGNVRELKHVIERAVLLSGGGRLTAGSLILSPEPSRSSESSQRLSDTLTLDAAERLLIQQALQRTEDNVSQAARELGVTRMALRYRIKKHGL